MRQVDIVDAFEWLPAHHLEGPVVTVLPDAAEVGMSIEEWQPWFTNAAQACFAASSGPTVFLQTDRKADRRWISKPEILIAAAAGRPLLWHKIVLRRDVGATDLHRPTYSHLMAFGPGYPGRHRPDVIEAGHYLWRNGIGINAARFVAEYLLETGNAPAILNPFAGMGTLLAAANEVGLDAYGCEIDAERAIAARHVSIADLVPG